MARFELAVLEAVFAQRTIEEIVEADRRLSRREVDYFNSTQGRATLVAAGLLGEDGSHTPAFDEAYAMAVEALPGALGLARKLELLTLFIDACVSDGDLEVREGQRLMRAAALLGVSNSEFDRHLDALTDRVGTLDLPEPEPEE